MTLTKTILDGVLIIEPTVFGDHRGWFMESWSMPKMQTVGLNYNFVQDNHSYSAQAGVLRGIHFQNGDTVQAKLVRCTRGAVLDVAVDLQKGSPTYKKWISIVLSAENKKQLLIPRGFGHGFLSLTNDVELLYKTDNPYNSLMDKSIHWNDPEIGIDWRITNPILSDKDDKAPLLKDSDCSFVYMEV